MMQFRLHSLSGPRARLDTGLTAGDAATSSGLDTRSLESANSFYLRGALARREQIAKSLAAFCASAATAYYARRDYEQPRVLERPSDRMAFYKFYGLANRSLLEVLSRF